MNLLKYHPLKYRGEVEERVENTHRSAHCRRLCARTDNYRQSDASLIGERRSWNWGCRGEAEDLGPLEIRCMAKNALILMIYTSKNIYSSSWKRLVWSRWLILMRLVFVLQWKFSNKKLHWRCVSNNTIVFYRTQAIKYFAIIIEVDRDRLGAMQKVHHSPRGGGVLG